MLSGSTLYERPAPRSYQLALTALWFGCLVGPWALVGVGLAGWGPLSWQPGWTAAPSSAWHFFVTEPFANEALVGIAISTLVLLAGVLALGWRRGRPRSSRPWSESLLLPAAALLPTLGVVWFWVLTRAPQLQAAIEKAGGSWPLGSQALAGTALALSLLLVAGPFLLLAGARRSLGRRFGSCEVGPDEVVFTPVAFLPYRLVAAKRDLGARETSSRGVWVDVPGQGRFLLPARGEALQAEALAALEAYDPADSDSFETGVTPRATWPVLLGLFVLAGAPLAAAVCNLGLAWLLPALVGVLALEAPALWLLRRWLSEDSDAARVHLGQDGLLARRWIPYQEVSELCPTPLGLALKTTRGRYLLRLGAVAPKVLARLKERSGRALPEVQRSWPSTRRRRLTGACLASLLLGGLALQVMAGPFPIYEVTQLSDSLGNSATQVTRLGDREYFLFLGPAPETVRLPFFQEVRLPGARPGLELDLSHMRLREGAGPEHELPAGTRLAVLGGTPRGLEASPTPASEAGLSLVWWAHNEQDLPISLPGLFRFTTPAPSEEQRVWWRYLHGFTSRDSDNLSDSRGDSLSWAVDQGQLRWLFSGSGADLVNFSLVEGRLELALSLSGQGWRQGDPGRLIWLGDWVRQGRAAVAFPGAPPPLREFLRLVERVRAGEAWEEAAGGALPFWELEPRHGISRGTLRELAASRFQPEPGEYPFSLSPGAAAEQRAHVASVGSDAKSWAVRNSLANLTARGLCESFQSPVERARFRSVEGVEWLGTSCTLEGLLAHLEPMLRDPSARVRAAAARALGAGWCPPEGGQPLLSALKSDLDLGVRLAVLEAFRSETFYPSAPEALEGYGLALSDPAQEAREHALSGAAYFLEHKLARTLEAQPQTRPRVAEQVARLLAELLEARPPGAELQPRCEDCKRRTPARLKAATLALAWVEELGVPTQRFLGPLDSASRSAEEPDLRAFARTALRRLKRGCTCELPSGLCWLRGAQAADGRWASPGGERDVALTALCLRAFLWSGSTHRFGDYKRQANRALTWLKRQLKADGSFKSGRATGLDQALGTQAICDAYAVSRDFTLKRYAKKPLEALIRLQNADGGWSEGEPGSPSSTIATACGVFALKAAKTSGLEVPEASFLAARAFLTRQTDAQGLVGPGPGELPGLDPADAEAAFPGPTAASVIARIFTGEARGGFADSVAHLTQPNPDRPAPLYWYFGTYALFQVGGRAWNNWHVAMRFALLRTRLGFEHAEHGSWNPSGVWGAWGGRAGVTALNTLTLEIYYRYERAQGH